jgi:hypothetical protein
LYYIRYFFLHNKKIHHGSFTIWLLYKGIFSLKGVGKLNGENVWARDWKIVEELNLHGEKAKESHCL